MILGRKEDALVLERLLRSDEEELLAVYGRRRVKKTLFYVLIAPYGAIGETGLHAAVDQQMNMNAFFGGLDALPMSEEDKLLEVLKFCEGLRH